jgi:hypothetical protein
MRRGGPDLLRWFSIGLIVAAVALTFYELLTYSRIRSRLPNQLSIAGVPVGGLDKPAALERLLQVYSTPVELLYGDNRILLNPGNVGFRLDTEVMFAVAETERTETDFWGGFWNFLWNRPGESVQIPLRADYSSSELEAVLWDIAARYDQPPSPPEPIPGSSSFEPGQPGRVLDIVRARELVEEILMEPFNRRVNLPVVAQEPPRPNFSALEILLKQNLDVADFNGLAVVYLQDLQNGDEIHFSRYKGEDIPVEPDISFTAASTIKVGIVTTFYRYFDEPLDPEAEKWLRETLVFSGNDPPDWLMERIDEKRGPLVVTETLREIGLESTFLAGYFRLGSELLSIYRTPGNQRTDVNTRPDIYNQTTAAELGMLLGDLYRCANGGGALLAVFPGEILPKECRTILNLLSENEIGVLIEAGVPEGTMVAHKHGWTDSPLDTVGDAGIVYTPGGNYVLSIFLWNDPEMIWEPTSTLIANLSRAVYNYYNSAATE